MQLNEIMKQKFGKMDKAQLRMVIMAMTPCSESAVKWFDDHFKFDFSTVPMMYLSWFARPFLTGADLTGADLTGADLTAAKHNGYTVWPNGFNYEQEGIK